MSEETKKTTEVKTTRTTEADFEEFLTLPLPTTALGLTNHQRQLIKYMDAIEERTAYATAKAEKLVSIQEKYAEKNVELATALSKFAKK